MFLYRVTSSLRQLAPRTGLQTPVRALATKPPTGKEGDTERQPFTEEVRKKLRDNILTRLGVKNDSEGDTPIVTETSDSEHVHQAAAEARRRAVEYQRKGEGKPIPVIRVKR
eukprot:TRINITY_DN1549_c0_g1_i1.p1 TRINITY_DN1549_c0_g1~~TRINITY_DN1549_c0_g1_i1.p1  ORF type:complete len:112 (-),score=16.18 TRINITY_DN1549_c0_g1_i1:367-702(-)